MAEPPKLADLSQASDDEVVSVIIDNNRKAGLIRRNLIWLQQWINDGRKKSPE